VFSVDLHCHSTASDGLLSPAAVARRAAEKDIRMLSLCDHDTVGGLAEASQAATEAGVRFINGVEISSEWLGQQVHILGYAFDPDDKALGEGLAAARSGRVERAKRMSLALEKVGVPGCFEGAMRYAENPELINRAHFARYIVEIGVCKTMQRVFDAYISPGRPGYVENRWMSIKDVVALILGAGGIASIAHPGRYKFSRNQMHSLFEEFGKCGGLAIEVVSGSHNAEEIARFARVAVEYGFAASCGSDFHGPSESRVDLGRFPPLPPDLAPIWDFF
jgi:predicted metal-dependent phosphoesterase TrpH